VNNSTTRNIVAVGLKGIYLKPPLSTRTFFS